MVMPLVCLCIESVLLELHMHNSLLGNVNRMEQHHVMALAYVAMARPIKLLRYQHACACMYI